MILWQKNKTMIPNNVIESGDFFYSMKKYNKWQISEKMVSAIKELKIDQYEGAYVDKGLLWDGEANVSILDKYRGNYDRIPFLTHLAISMQLLVRTVKINDIPNEIVESLGIKDYHISLLNRLYIDYDNYDHNIGTGDKRPFGNSAWEGDVFEEYDSSILEDDDLYQVNIPKAVEIYNTVLELAKYVISNFTTQFRNFVACDYQNEDKLMNEQKEYLNHGWCPDMVEFRDIKIDKILNEKELN